MSRIASSSRPGRQHVLAGEHASALGAPRGDRVANRAVLAVVLEVELVEVGARWPTRASRETCDAPPSPSARSAGRRPRDRSRRGTSGSDAASRARSRGPGDRRGSSRRALRVARLKRRSARSSSARSSSVIFGVAISVARLSSSARTMNASRISSSESIRTRTPRFGSKLTSPSAARRRSASRTGVRLTWNCSERCSWRSVLPGGISPETIASSRASAMSSAFVPSDMSTPPRPRAAAHTPSTSGSRRRPRAASPSRTPRALRRTRARPEAPP